MIKRIYKRYRLKRQYRQALSNFKLACDELKNNPYDRAAYQKVRDTDDILQSAWWNYRCEPANR